MNSTTLVVLAAGMGSRYGGHLKTVTERLKIERSTQSAFDRDTETEFTGTETVSMNMWGFTPDFFAVLESEFNQFSESSINIPKAEFLLPEVVDTQIKRNEQQTGNTLKISGRHHES